MHRQLEDARARELRKQHPVFGRGSIEFIPRTFLTGYDDDDRALMKKMAAAAGVPLHLNTLAPLHPSAPDGWQRSVEFARSAKAEGLGIALIRRIETDDPTSLIGLPLIALTEMLERAGLPVI